jgi:hypothetical protein
MAKLSDYTREKPFTAKHLSDTRRDFSLLSIPTLQTGYREALERCRLA